MPGRFHFYTNRSAEHRAREAQEKQKKLASWERLKAQVAAKYQEA